jgi:uncharacterized protein YcbK (DUF882 family)
VPSLVSLPALIFFVAQSIAGPAADGVPPALKAPAPAPKAAAKPAVKPAAKPAVKPARATAKKRTPPKPKVVELFQVNTKESLRLRFVDDRGRRIPGLQRRADRFFRCHHTGRVSRMNPRLIKLLFDTGRHWPASRLEVVSGYRHPKVAKNPRSPHMKGLACDFRVVGVKNTDLRDYLRRAFPHVGVGYYPNSSFVHLDVRKGGSAFWIDYSGPGENALYSDNPGEDLRSGRADSFRPTTIDPAWAEHDEPPAPVEVAGGAPGREAQPAAAGAVGQSPAAASELSTQAGR